MTSVYVTGRGCVTSLGNGLVRTADKLRQGESGIKPVSRISAQSHKNFKAGAIPNDDTPGDRPLSWTKSAVKEAISDSGRAPEDFSGTRTGIFLGTTACSVDLEERSLMDGLKAKKSVDPRLISKGVGALASEIAREYRIFGPTLTYSTACTSSALAIIGAADSIRAGKIDRAIVIGVEPLLNLTMYGFRSLLLFDEDTIRPFDQRRNGLQLGEGAAALVLEAGTDKTRFEYLSGFAASDSSHITASDEEGEFVDRVVSSAILGARLDPSEICGIKAHGTGTWNNDLSEGRGLRRTFREKVPPFVSLKGYFGHSLGAAGVIETAAHLACLENGFVPKCLGFEEADQNLGIQPETQTTDAKLGPYLYTFFGFGGSNAAYVIRDQG